MSQQLGALIATHGEMGIVWRIDLYHNLVADFEKYAPPGGDLDENWLYADEGFTAEGTAWLEYLLGPDPEFYCGNALPYDWRVIPITLGQPIFDSWSDD